MRTPTYPARLFCACFLIAFRGSVAAEPDPVTHVEKGVALHFGLQDSPINLAVEDWHLQAGAPKSQFKPGEMIAVQVAFLNVAKEARLIELVNDDLRNVIIMVKGPDGKQPPWSAAFSSKRLGEMQASGFGCKLIRWRVNPRASLKFAFRLNEIYDLAKPGQYEVRVAHKLELVNQLTVLRPFYLEGRHPGPPFLASKPFKFTISSPKKSPR